MLSAIFLLLVYYSFVVDDKTYYTDIITSFLSFIFGILDSYNMMIGIGIDNSLGYDTFRSVPIALMFGGISIIMIFIMIVKIIDVVKEKDDMEASNE